MMGSYIVLILFAFLVEGVFGEVMSVMEGNRVTLNTGVTNNPGDVFQWYFEDTLIALVNGHPENNCLYYYYGKCDIFKDRLDMDYKTGSLIITTSRPEHTGRYEAEFIKHDNTGKTERIIMSSKCERTQTYPKGSDLVIPKSFNLTVRGGVFGEVMSVMKGNRVTLNTGVTKNPDDTFQWYFEDTLIALVNGHPNTSCLYYGKDEIFKDRLDVDYKTGSLIITTSRPEHTGRYQAEFIIHDNTGKTERIIMSSKCDQTKTYPKGSDLVIKKSFILTVRDEVMSVMKGNRVTLNAGVTNNPDDTLLWYFEETLIALVNGHPEDSCLYYGKDEIFKDRLEVDYATGSLIITTFRPEHTGRYQAEFIEGKPGKTETIIMSSKCDQTKIYPKGSDLVIHKSFNLTVSDLSPGEIAGIVIAVLLLVAAAVGVMIYRRRSSRNDIEKNKQKLPDQVSEEKRMISKEHNSSG